MMQRTLVRNLFFIFIIGALLLSLNYALEQSDRDVLSFFFGEHQLKTLEDYQNKYTPIEALELKIKGRLPALPDEPRPVQPVAGDAVVEEQPAPLVDSELTEEQASAPLLIKKTATDAE